MKLYIINHCNAWHEYSSFRFIGAVDESELENALHKIQEETEYTDEEMETYIYIDEVELNKLDI